MDGTLTVDFMTDSFSTYTLTTNAAAETGNSPVSWGTTVPSVTPTTDENGVATWDVSGTQYRYLDIPVSVNVSSLPNGTTITLPYSLDIGDAGRDKYKPQYNNVGNTGDGWTVEPGQENVTITINKELNGHQSIDIYYRFDCWNVVSGQQFELKCTVTNGGEGRGGMKEYPLTGCIKTGNGGTIIKYLLDWDESLYSLNGFGGADKKGAYILAWSKVYETYFGPSSFDTATYIYDIAAYEVQPTGQQPYSISGTITPDQNGEVISGVYMMDSAKNPDALYVKISASTPTVEGGKNKYNFEIGYDDLKSKVVSSFQDTLSGASDHGTYTLYFLVRYPRNSLNGYDNVKDWNGIVIDQKVKLNATLNLIHRGVDSGEEAQIQGETIFCCYDGASQVDLRTYWASYYSNAVESRAGLTMLKGGNTATVEYSADFFSLSEARGITSTMVAIIDLAYLTNNGKQQLEVGDYRISGFNLSLIDAPGSWSQNTTNTPNVGWTPDQYGSPKSSDLGYIRVYGSTSLAEEDWTEIGLVSAASVWALNQDRAFTGKFTPIDGDYVRLKVEYDSKYTTALRVGYQMELQPGIVEKYRLSEAETLSLTNWVNYGAYKNDTIKAENADLEHFRFQKFPTTDNLTAVDVRDYDSRSGALPGYNVKTEIWDYNYSLRIFANGTLGCSTDAAGMMMAQVLYDSNGNVVGTKKNPDSLNPNESYSRQTEVVNVSEIVYTISGAVTSGASSLNDLKERQTLAGNGSPYQSTMQRYYVLLPEGLRLNTNPQGEHYASGTVCLSANSTFYKDVEGQEGNNPKVVDGGQIDVPVSSVNVPGLNRDKGDNSGYVSEMIWKEDGIATCVSTTMVDGRQLVIFDRTLPDYSKVSDKDEPARFDIWDWGGKPTYFWGRGLSFSVVPTNGTGSLPAGEYTPQFWCQFLDGDGTPISLSDFDQVTTKAELDGQDASTLLYIPSTFVNKHHEGGSDGEIEVKIDNDFSVSLDDGTTAVKPEGTYSYPLTYNVTTGSSTNVVLWCNVEEMSRFDLTSEWHGTVTGVDLGIETGVKVYVMTDLFTASEYEGNANQSWLTDGTHGWMEVTGETDWPQVKAIAFSFGDKTFNSNNPTATVSIKMKAPEDDPLNVGGKPKDPNKTVYTAYNELLISDKHVEASGGNDKLACYFANYVSVLMKVTPVSYVLPSTGGAGTTTLYTTGVAFLTASAYLMYQSLRRSRVTGVPAAEPEDKRGGSRVR